MIPLRIPAESLPISEPLVVRLRAFCHEGMVVGDHDGILLSFENGVAEFDVAGFSLRLRIDDPKLLDGDVLLVLPGRKSADRLIRARSPHNTFLVTERCDQVCVMCSQPPKTFHIDMFNQFAEAANLAPEGAWIGISGGEPLLFKRDIFELISTVHRLRPDIRFHVLTNAQHFEAEDTEALCSAALQRVLWGIPIYADDSSLHDRIVGKPDAFSRLLRNLAILARAGAEIELRTVAMLSNQDVLPTLARFISTHLPFAQVWAIMQMENIGYGRMNWDKEFWDTSLDFKNLGAAIDIARAYGINVALYNFPSCTVPGAYRHLAANSISDWKQKFVPVCTSCSIRSTCGGFFEWYREKDGFAVLGET